MNMIEVMDPTDNEFVASSLAEDEHPVWAAGTTYALGARVILSHRIFQSMRGGNLGNNPMASTEDGSNWILISATNRWKAFDQKISNPAVAAGLISYRIGPNIRCDAIAMFGVRADSVTIFVNDNSVPPVRVFTQEYSMLDTSDIVDNSSYFFGEIDFDSELIAINIPAFPGFTIGIDISVATGDVLVGQIAVGRLREIGITQAGTSVGIQDFSSKERDVFGNLSAVEKPYIVRVDFLYAFQTKDMRRVNRILTRNRARTNVFFASEELMQIGATVFGAYDDFDMPTSIGQYSFGSLEIRGIT